MALATFITMFGVSFMRYTVTPIANMSTIFVVSFMRYTVSPIANMSTITNFKNIGYTSFLFTMKCICKIAKHQHFTEDFSIFVLNHITVQLSERMKVNNGKQLSSLI